MSAEVDYSHQWSAYPVELDGWVLAHRMLIADQTKIKTALASFVAQTEDARVPLTPQQLSAFRKFWTMYVASLHHHHNNEEKIAFPYLTEVKKAFNMQKVTSDHVTLLSGLDKCEKMVDALTVNSASTTRQVDDEAKLLRDLLNSFTVLDEALVEHFHEEEDTFLLPTRKVCTVKEFRKNITNPIVASMNWVDRGQYFGKLHPETQLKPFMKLEGIPFFVKWIFRSNINRYNKAYVLPLDEAMEHAKNCVVAATEKPGLDIAASPAPVLAAGCECC